MRSEPLSLYDSFVAPRTALFCLVLALAGSVQAQGTASITPHHDPHPLTEYSGVTPGEGDHPPAERRVSGRGRARGRRPPATVATWPGFQPETGGSSRFFVQTNEPITTTMSASSGRVEITFPNTRTHLSNTRRWLETEFFDTPVLRAHFERRRHDLVLVFFMRNAIGGSTPVSVTPRITSGTDPSGYFFTYIDFPAGHWIEEPVAPPPEPSPTPPPRTTEPGTTAPRRDDPSFDSMDEERPPPVERGPSP